MWYGGTAAVFTPAEAKAPTLEHHKAQPNRQETEKHQQGCQEICKKKKKKKESSEDVPSQPGQNMSSLLQREHPARAGQARQEETELAHENTRLTAYTGFRQATKAATAQQIHAKGTVKHERS